MFDQATLRTGIRYGVTAGVAGFAIILLVYGRGGDPFGPGGLLSYLLLPFFMVAGLNYYKAYQEDPLGFGRAFGVALSISLYTAITSALLLYAFTILAGPEVVVRHQENMRAMLEMTQEDMVSVFGQNNMEVMEEGLDNRGPYQLASEDFLRRIFFGFLISLIIAFFKRK